VFYFESSKKTYFLNRALVYIYLPKASKYLYIGLNISILLPMASNSLYISVTIDFQIAISWCVLYSISLSAQIYVQIQSDDPPLSSTQRVMSPTTVLFLQIQGYVPFCSVIPTWIAMSHTAVLNLHIELFHLL
jgi:hypothetical protein